MALDDLRDPERSKANYKGKCVYLLMLVKQANRKAWERLSSVFQDLDVDDSYLFYQALVAEYQNLRQSPKNQDPGPVDHPFYDQLNAEPIEPVAPIQKKIVKKDESKPKSSSAEEEKKTTKKKTAKKVAKKTAAKKVTKKKTAAKKAPAKKSAAKKTAKKKKAKKR